MQKIKMSFTKAFPFIIAFNIFLMAVSNITERLQNSVIRNADSAAWNGVQLFFDLVIIIAVSPLYIGIYRFCFERVKGRNPHILTTLDFYRSVGGFFKSTVARLITKFAADFFVPVVCEAVMLSNFASREENFLAGLIIALFIFILSELFFLLPYAYAENPAEGLAVAIKKSIKRGLKFMIVLLLLELAEYGTNALILKFYRNNIDYGLLHRAGENVGYTNNIFNFILMLVLSSVMAWIEFTVVYIILGVTPKERNAAANTVYSELSEDTENKKEKPFIEPYDFFIEADERFNDEKIIETEDIRGVDILAVLDEMNLADDIKIDLAIRKKLKRMFEDLSFEIGEYVTYEGGREIENDFTEEIDDRLFTVSVTITRSSDYEPFKLILRINVLKED